jgi:hypothetical protein
LLLGFVRRGGVALDALARDEVLRVALFEDLAGILPFSFSTFRWTA